MSIKYNVIIQREENWYVAKCIDSSVASQGKTIEEAMENLKEASEYIHKMKNQNNQKKFLLQYWMWQYEFKISCTVSRKNL